MKLRHARAVAVCAVALVALTGARGSHGGGCDNSSGGSGSSSSGGSSTSGGHDDVGKDDSSGGVSGSGGSSGSSGSVSSGGVSGGGRDKAIKDLKIESCKYTEALGVTARVRVTNNSDQTYDYTYKVTFTGPSGELLRTANPSIPFVTGGSTDTLDTSAAYVAEAGDDLTQITCKLHDATRTAG
ncbi:hypothetical protein [Streptomyces cavernicola]|uniref:Secreted protein n=1 Tax=Streptomyces cavernicola TaxID=3043613 RepID=A0ABT6SJ79_9ACTN|nr:hypothetical protein [Streptomyces sp. B-S-A6]MDI3407934.1 hypothetical protein [Streptomyces sp. B-S-A6]